MGPARPQGVAIARPGSGDGALETLGTGDDLLVDETCVLLAASGSQGEIQNDMEPRPLLAKYLRGGFSLS